MYKDKYEKYKMKYIILKNNIKNLKGGMKLDLTISITVSSLNRESYEYKINKNTTVSKLKYEVAISMKVKMNTIRLLLDSGNELEKGKLFDLGIKDGDNIIVIVEEIPNVEVGNPIMNDISLEDINEGITEILEWFQREEYYKPMKNLNIDVDSFITSLNKINDNLEIVNTKRPHVINYIVTCLTQLGNGLENNQEELKKETDPENEIFQLEWLTRPSLMSVERTPQSYFEDLIRYGSTVDSILAK